MDYFPIYLQSLICPLNELRVISHRNGNIQSVADARKTAENASYIPSNMIQALGWIRLSILATAPSLNVFKSGVRELKH